MVARRVAREAVIAQTRSSTDVNPSLPQFGYVTGKRDSSGRVGGREISERTAGPMRDDLHRLAQELTADLEVIRQWLAASMEQTEDSSMHSPSGRFGTTAL